MFDFSLGEMLVVALVALVVLGPERLPKAARFAGLWVRKARAQWHAVRSELEQELASEELQRSLRESQQALRDAEARLREATAQVQADAPRALDPPATSDGERRDG
ncbi:Sec-independent protein translocase protein TatB [Thermomonas fusca]|jgi:sec-independent protein translocase protein TatB|uniref:Sec-independent protein translocase protein TatB n=1 Tax=Thermomonas fusca TaxID=215690 RepID=UPI00040DA11B